MKLVAQFDLSFHSETRHRIRVRVHRTVKQMRDRVRRINGSRVGGMEACCVQFNCRQDDHALAELHFCLPYLSVGNIAHECLHAAWHRLDLMGQPEGATDSEEWLATDTGHLTDAIVAYLSRKKIKFPIA